MERIELSHLASGAGSICAEILASLPAWFGIPEANADYARGAEANRSVVAFGQDAQPVGIATLTRFGEHAAEVHVIAVRPEWHRRGVGRLMLESAENWLRGEGVEYLQVKTLSWSSPDEAYARTRDFYFGVGFRALEEFPELWDPSNPALQLIKRL